MAVNKCAVLVNS